MNKLKIGWLSTGRDEAARQLLKVIWDAITEGSLKAEMAFVFCNRERGEAPQSDAFIRLVESMGIPLITFSSAKFKPHLRRQGLSEERSGSSDTIARWRELYDRQLLRLLRPYPIDLGVLAGYMLIVSPVLCGHYHLINLHPAAPGGPKGTWQEVIWQLIGQKAQETGAMMHLVTPELDAGPPITYCTFSLQEPSMEPLWRQVEGRTVEEIRSTEGESNPLFREIRRRGLAREFPLILYTLRAFAEGDIRIRDGKVISRDGRIYEGGYPLTGWIDEVISASQGGFGNEQR